MKFINYSPAFFNLLNLPTKILYSFYNSGREISFILVKALNFLK